MGSVESFSSISLHQCTSARPLRFATTHARQNIMFVHSRMHTYSSIVSKEGTHTEAKREVLSLFLSSPLPDLSTSSVYVLIIIYGATPTSTIAQRLLLADSQLGRSRNQPIVSSFVR